MEKVNLQGMKRDELIAYIEAMNERIEFANQLIERNEELAKENESLRDYTAMANQESQRMSLELFRTQKKMNAVFNAQKNLLATMENVVNMSKENLEANLQEELNYKKLNNKEEN